MAALEKRFDQDMLDIYTTAKKECGYNASRFLQMVGTKGGLAVAKQLISKPGGTDFDAARAFGIRALSAPGLPGKWSPDAAAGAVRDAIYRIMEDEKL